MFFWQKAKKKQDDNATETKSTNCPWSSYVLLQLVPSAKCAPGVGNMYGRCCCRSFSIHLTIAQPDAMAVIMMVKMMLMIMMAEAVLSM